MSNSFIWPKERILTGATILGQSGPVSDGNEGVLHIPQSSSISGASPSDSLVSYLGHSLEGVLPLCKDAVWIFYNPSRLGFKTDISRYLLPNSTTGSNSIIQNKYTS